MLVNKIRLIGLYTVDLPISVARPSDSYTLKGADGFGPSDVTVSIVDSVIQGGAYQGRRPINKQLTLNLGLNPNFKMGETAAILRERLYGMLTPEASDSVTVHLMNDDVVVALIRGYVSKITPNIFVNEPEVQVVIDCDWPYFQAPEAFVFVPLTKEFFIVHNEGNARTGMLFELTFTEDRHVWRLFDANGRVMHFDYNFKFGDTLRFNTQPGNRFIEVVRSGTVINIIHTLMSDSTWLMLRGGNNAFTTGYQSFIWGSITYTPQYEGI